MNILLFIIVFKIVINKEAWKFLILLLKSINKHLDFLNWKEAYNLIEIKAHHKKYGLEGINKIKSLKNSMNNKRTEFSWLHLNNFYNRIR